MRAGGEGSRTDDEDDVDELSSRRRLALEHSLDLDDGERLLTFDVLAAERWRRRVALRAVRHSRCRACSTRRSCDRSGAAYRDTRRRESSVRIAGQSSGAIVGGVVGTAVVGGAVVVGGALVVVVVSVVGVVEGEADDVVGSLSAMVASVVGGSADEGSPLHADAAKTNTATTAVSTELVVRWVMGQLLAGSRQR